ncbi:MAG: hypothetical protein DYG90_02650 [Chloroflexi bacterium CFX6]|nr:hypothetical protein [Chloroflexi bacterium CFX6]
MMSTISEPRDNQPPSWTLDIAGLRLSVAFDAVLPSRALDARYAAYRVAAAPSMKVRVHWSDADDESEGTEGDWPSARDDRGERTRFARGVLVHRAPGRAGEIDVADGVADLRLTGARAAEHTDYFLRLCVALLAVDADGLLLHAAGVVRDGVAYAFVGPSGSGKTTVARHSAGATLNDDLIVLRPGPTGWSAFSTPFSNPTQIAPSGPRWAPLGGIYRLVHAPAAAIERVDAATAVADLVASAPVVGLDPDRAARLMARADAIVRAVPFGRLHCRPDPSFWPLIAPAPVPADLPAFEPA